MGRRTNQAFVSIPHSRFIEMLTYKAQLVGIQVLVREESYTSAASFLDRDAIPTYDPQRTEKPVFSGKREQRGLYRAKDGRRINADVNGSYNILRKEFPHAFSDSQAGAFAGDRGAAVAPSRLAPKRREHIGCSGQNQPSKQERVSIFGTCLRYCSSQMWYARGRENRGAGPMWQCPSPQAGVHPRSGHTRHSPV